VTLLQYSFAVAGILLVGLTPALLALSGPEARWAAAFGALLAGLNSIAAPGLFRWSKGRSTKAFLVAVLGGMSVRMIVVACGVVLAMNVAGLPALPLVLSLLLGFALFLGLEIVAQKLTPASV
jgi:hypothetical protein